MGIGTMCKMLIDFWVMAVLYMNYDVHISFRVLSVFKKWTCRFWEFYTHS